MGRPFRLSISICKNRGRVCATRINVFCFLQKKTFFKIKFVVYLTEILFFVFLIVVLGSNVG